MKILMTILITLLVVILGAVAFAYSGLYDVSASSGHAGIMKWFLATTSHASVERRAGDVAVPELDDEALILAGASDYDAMCVACHGGPGIEPDAAGQGLNPPASDLAEEAEEMTPAELFWVTKHGIKMTGMPAWGATHDDDAIWPVVAFLTKLPGLDEAGYRALLERGAGQGHHAGADRDAADDPTAEESGAKSADQHDHGSHDHHKH